MVSMDLSRHHFVIPNLNNMQPLSSPVPNAIILISPETIKHYALFINPSVNIIDHSIEFRGTGKDYEGQTLLTVESCLGENLLPAAQRQSCSVQVGLHSMATGRIPVAILG